MNYAGIDIIFGNGMLTESQLQLCLENLPPKTLSPSQESPIYIVGLTHTEADGLGAWVDDALLYVDPVCFCQGIDEATEVAKKQNQLAIFKLTGVSEAKVVSDTLSVIQCLEEYSKKYGGATAVRKSYGYLVFAGEGEVIYL